MYKFYPRTNGYALDRMEKNLKGVMAECLVEEMLIAAHLDIIRFGYEYNRLHLLHPIYTEPDNEKSIRKFKKAPDFAIMKDGRCIHLIEVKYRKWGKPYIIPSEQKLQHEANCNDDLDKIIHLRMQWPQTTLVIVNSMQLPYFNICSTPFIEDGRFTTNATLQELKILDHKIPDEVYKQAEFMVNRYFNHK